MTTEEKIKVMQAYVDGEAIQVSPIGWAMWSDINTSENSDWNWVEYDYRIKPEEKKPTYRPYKDTAEMVADYEERFNVLKCPPHVMPLIWVKSGRDKYLITGFTGDVVWVDGIHLPYASISTESLFEKATYLDGSPVGKLVEE